MHDGGMKIPVGAPSHTDLLLSPLSHVKRPQNAIPSPDYSNHVSQQSCWGVQEAGQLGECTRGIVFH